MLLEVLLFKGFYFINIAILCKKHTIFFILLAKDSSMLNKEIGANLLSYSYRSVNWFVWYGITKDSKIREANMLFVFLVLLLWDICTEISIYSKDILVWEKSTYFSLFTCLVYVNFTDYTLMYST